MMEWRRRGALAGERPRVIVTTDIGGTDPDDFQSMVHYLLYSDVLDTEGLISSPFTRGSAADLHAVIDVYAQDYPALRTWSADYPAPDVLHGLVKQGLLTNPPYRGWDRPTEASEWIIRCARREDPRPLHVLVWGSLDDVAQALHDAPDILPRLRVNYIGGPNKKWGPNAYAYIRENFPDLWMIEDNATYRGWFNGGDMSGEWGNTSFVTAHAAGHGALGTYFASHLGGAIKMGDTPTVTHLLRGDPEDPAGNGWGGRFVPVRDMPTAVRRHPVTAEVPVEVFQLTELIFPGPVIPLPEAPVFQLETRGQRFEGFATAPGEYRIRFVCKETGDFPFALHSDIPGLDGLTGCLTAVPQREETRQNSAGNLTRWWSDDLAPAWREGVPSGAKTVSCWRRDFLADFADRLDCCQGARDEAE